MSEVGKKILAILNDCIKISAKFIPCTLASFHRNLILCLSSKGNFLTEYLKLQKKSLQTLLMAARIPLEQAPSSLP